MRYIVVTMLIVAVLEKQLAIGPFLTSFTIKAIKIYFQLANLQWTLV